MKQFIKFGIVGTIGFIVDASILLILVHIFYFEISIARFFSFLIAVFVTWLINRNFTFSDNKNIDKKKEYFYYLVIQFFGVLLNYLIFISLINQYTFFREHLILPLAIASIIAMFSNYLILKKVVYKIDFRS